MYYTLDPVTGQEKPPGRRMVFLYVPNGIRTANISLQDPCLRPGNQQQPTCGLAYQFGIR